MGIMENQMETTIVYWGNMGIMEKKTLNPKPQTPEPCYSRTICGE